MRITRKCTCGYLNNIETLLWKENVIYLHFCRSLRSFKTQCIFGVIFVGGQVNDKDLITCCWCWNTEITYVIPSWAYTWPAGKISRKSCGRKCMKFWAFLKKMVTHFVTKNVWAFLECFLLVKRLVLVKLIIGRLPSFMFPRSLMKW